MPVDPFNDNNRHLLPLPDSILRDLGRNEAATREYRKAAVEILWNRKSPYVKHSDLRQFVEELEIELDGIVFDHPASGPGPLTSSVTTRTMFSDGPVIEFTGFDDVEIVEPRNIEEDHASIKPDRANKTVSRKKKEPDASE